MWAPPVVSAVDSARRRVSRLPPADGSARRRVSQLPWGRAPADGSARRSVSAAPGRRLHSASHLSAAPGRRLHSASRLSAASGRRLRSASRLSAAPGRRRLAQVALDGRLQEAGSLQLVTTQRLHLGLPHPQPLGDARQLTVTLLQHAAVTRRHVWHNTTHAAWVGAYIHLEKYM